MPRIEAIYIAPVKSLALQQVERASLTRRGLAGDREFFLVNDRNRLVTMREYGPLATLRPMYDEDRDLLRIEFPDGRALEAAPGRGDEVSARFFGKYDVAAYEVEGPWALALSDFTGLPVRLVRASARSGVDAFPVSLLSAASVDALRASSGAAGIDARRFRPNILVTGVSGAHAEDGWIDRTVRLGEAAIRVRMRDERCAVTTLDPSTGKRDLNTLSLIAGYRTDQEGVVNFGVYATVETEGEIAVGDAVEALDAGA